MLSKSFFFVACLLIASGAMGQTGQLEIKTPWARATPGPADPASEPGKPISRHSVHPAFLHGHLRHASLSQLICRDP